MIAWLTIIAGLLLILLGGLLCLTIIGAIVGIPVLILGIWLIIRGFQ